MEENIMQFEKLSGNNYTTWSFKMKLYLETKDLWSVIEENLPVDGRENWLKKDKIAMNVLVQSLNSIQTHYVLNQRSAKEIWKKLKEIHSGRMLENKINIRRELSTIKWKKTDNVEKYMERLQGLVEKLRAMGENMEDAEAAALAVHGLPKCYSKIQTSFNMSAALTMTPARIKYALLKEEEMLNGDKVDEEIANRTRAYGYEREKRSKGIFQSVKCYKCNKYGHIARNCHNNIESRNYERYNNYQGNNTRRKQNNSYESKYIKNENQKVHEVREQVEQKEKKTEYSYCAYDIYREEIKNKIGWTIDSAATSHMTGRKEPLHNYQIEAERKVELADGSVKYSKGIGEVRFKNLDSEDKFTLRAKNVLFVPGLMDNLLSVRKLTENNVRIIFEGNKCEAYHREDGQLLFTATNRDGLYKLNSKEILPVETLNRITDEKVKRWHRRLVHINQFKMKKMSGHDSIRDFNLKVTGQEICEECLRGKQRRRSFKTIKEKQSKEILELIHVDLCGPIRTDSIGGSKYIFTIVDDYSKKIFLYFVKTKDETADCLINFIKMSERESGKFLKRIRSDNGKEFLNRQLKEFFVQNGIRHELSNPDTPQQNGIAERANRIIIETVRTMLSDSKLPHTFWAEAASTAVHVINRCIKEKLDNKTPEEIWTGRRPTFSYFKIFGCLAHTWIPERKRTKLDEKSETGIFVGYCMNRKGYRIFDPKMKRIYATTDVKFSENDFGADLLNEEETNQNEEFILFQEEKQNNEESINQEHQDNIQLFETNEQQENAQQQELRRSTRNRKKTEILQINPDAKSYKANEMQNNSETYEEIINREDRKQWEKAMEEELNSHRDMQTWEIVERKKDTKIVKSKWVYKVKDGKYKARLVAVGCSQRKGIDYEETFSPVMKIKSLRTILAIANKEQLHLRQLDVKTAYLHGELEEELYMEIPAGSNMYNERKKYVCKLKKAIYGLRQSGRIWNSTINKKFEKLGFKRCETDRCVYIKKNNQNFMIIALYVDDMLLASNNEILLEECIQQLKSEIKIKDLGEPTNILGLRITRDKYNKRLGIDQQVLIEKLLKENKMEDCKPVKSPMDEGIKLKCVNMTNSDEKYQSIIGSLMYLVQGTRPDITYATYYLSQFNNCHGEEHLKALKRVIRYLKGTKERKLIYEDKNIKLDGYSDASWNSHTTDGKSTSGYLFKLFGTAISWSSKKQSTVALSTCEAEYIALTEAVKEGKWIEMFLREIGYEKMINKILTIKTDNQAAKHLAENPIKHQRTKHMELRYFFIRDEIENNRLKIEYSPSEEMEADGMTKPLGPLLLKKELEKYGIKENFNQVGVC